MFCPRSIIPLRWPSSHWVSACHALNSGAARIPRRTSTFVLTPPTFSSESTLWALLSTLSQVAAVTMILAIMLSKSEPTTTGDKAEMLVSTRTPLPPGTWNSVIFPILNAKFALGSSAHNRNWIECGPGGVSGSLFAPKPTSPSDAPCASNN